MSDPSVPIEVQDNVVATMKTLVKRIETFFHQLQSAENGQIYEYIAGSSISDVESYPLTVRFPDEKDNYYEVRHMLRYQRRLRVNLKGLPFDTMMEGAQTVKQPEHSIVIRNYPNPFNPSTLIRYQLPATSHVNLTVYDIFGRKVTELVSSIKDAGIHEVTFDGSGLVSGIYIYRLLVGDFDTTGKIILMK